MKKLIITPLIINTIICLPVLSADYVFDGSGGPYTLSSGDTLEIQSGIYTGSMNFPAGTTIEVNKDATFRPMGLWNGAGTLTVHSGATVELPTVTFNEGMVIDNSGDLTFVGSVDMYGSISIINRDQTPGNPMPTMYFSSAYQLSHSSEISNLGLMTFNDDLSTGEDSILNNSGTVTAKGFTPNGEVTNDGVIRTTGKIQIDYKADVTNNCSLIAEKGFINNGWGTDNNGIIITTDPMSNITFNRPFNQSPTGYTQGGGIGEGFGMINNTAITGGGNYYFTGETRNNVLFGLDFDKNDINFYDSDLAEGSEIFDVEKFLYVDTTKNPITPINADQAMTACTYDAIINVPEISNDATLRSFTPGIPAIPEPIIEVDSAYDYGDAPVSGLAPNGVGTSNYGEAYHVIKANIYLGNTPPDEDVINQAEPYAAGDDSNGLADDEDGVDLPDVRRGQNFTLPVLVNGANGKLQAWIDWNGDGDFTDKGEQIAQNLEDNGASNDINAGDGTINVSITVPSNATLNSTYARFRWSTSSGVGATGVAADGEVEDYMITIQEAASTAECVMDDLDTRQYSSASPSASSRFLTEKTFVYEATFDTADWSGRILAYNLYTDQGKGGIKSVIWDSTNTVTADERSVFSYNPMAEGTKGTLFSWETLNEQQQKWLARSDGEKMGQARLNWVKGITDDTEFGQSLRVRNSLMGDIIHSSLTLRDPITNYGYKSLPGPEGAAYAGFLSSKRNSSPSLLVGTNDGMFHALDPKTGKEFFSYVPNEIMSRLPNISNAKYGCTEEGCVGHEYTVDGISTLGDAYLSSGWRSIVISTLGLGGRALFALDVTDPLNFGTSDILWEVSSTQAPTNADFYAKHLGYTLPSVSIVRAKNGQWVAVFGNGYNSESQQAVLFIIDVETGELIRTFNTNQGSESSPNGMSTPTVIDIDGDSIADRIYSGDLHGNLWSIDVSSEDPAAWGFAYGSATAPEPLFQTCTDNSCSSKQSITAAPQIGQNRLSGLMVYIGTGKYVDVSDSKIESTGHSFDSFYGIQDDGVIVTRRELVKQEILAEIEVKAGLKSRITSDNTVDYTSKRGWYMDLLTPPASSPDGERVITKAILRGGRIIFTTLAPSVENCELGGDSWLMEMDANDGSRLSVIAFDVNDDMSFTEADNMNFNGSPTIITGLRQDALGLVRSAPVIVRHTTRSEGKYVSGSETGVGMFRESASRFSGRMSWTNISH